VVAAADPKRIHLVKSARVGGKDKTFSLVTDLHLLRKEIERIGNVVLIIIDPVSAYLGVGKVDGRSATDVRGVLTPMKDMAEELHVAVIGIAHFNKKDDIKSALVRALAAVGAFCIDKWKHRMAWYQNPSMCVSPRQRTAPWLRWRSRNA
jgi:hypothetical protein